MIPVRDQIFLDIKINDKDFDKAMQNFLEHIEILEDTASGIPTLSLIINDMQDILSTDQPFSDGDKITIRIGKDIQEISENYPFDFRLFSWQAKRTQAGMTYTITAVLDRYSYIKNISTFYQEGNSLDVLSAIAGKCNLDFVTNANSSDKQVWLNIADTRSVFAKKIVSHSYIPSGALALAVTANGNMVCKDIVKTLKESPKTIFTSIPEDSNTPSETYSGNAKLSTPSSNANSDTPTKVVREYNPSSSSGFLNSWVNYGFSLHEDLLTGDHFKHKDLSVDPGSGTIAINNEIKSQVDTGKVTYAPQDCGNTHEKYWYAYYQNLRIMALFSQRVTILIDEVSNLDLLDLVELRLYNNSGILNAFSGKYVVASKKTIIRGTKYAEILEVYRMSVNKTSKTPTLAEIPASKNVSASGDNTKTIPLEDMPVLRSGEKAKPVNKVTFPAEVATHPEASQILPTSSTLGVDSGNGTSTSGSGGSRIVTVSNLGSIKLTQ